MFELELRARLQGGSTVTAPVYLNSEPQVSIPSDWPSQITERAAGYNVGPSANGVQLTDLEPITDAVAEKIAKQIGKLDGYRITGGGVDIWRYTEVTNCIFEARHDSLYVIRFRGGSMVAQATVFDGQGRPNLTGEYDPNLDAPSAAIGPGVYELYECEVKNTVDGLKGPRVVRDSLVHKLIRTVGSNGDTSHNDCIQYVGGTDETGCTLTGNTLRPFNLFTQTLGNAGVMFSIKNTPLRGVEISYNLFDGGNNTLQLGGDLVSGRVHHNLFTKNIRYGAVAARGPEMEFDRETNLWQGSLTPVA